MHRQRVHSLLRRANLRLRRAARPDHFVLVLVLALALALALARVDASTIVRSLRVADVVHERKVHDVHSVHLAVLRLGRHQRRATHPRVPFAHARERDDGDDASPRHRVDERRERRSRARLRRLVRRGHEPRGPRRLRPPSKDIVARSEPEDVRALDAARALRLGDLRAGEHHPRPAVLDALSREMLRRDVLAHRGGHEDGVCVHFGEVAGV